MAHTFEQEQQAFHKKAETDSAVKLRFFDIDSGNSLLFDVFNPSESRALKLRALARLGITPREGETPLNAWCRVMAEENGLPVQIPAHKAIADAVLFSSAQKFVFFLA
jgi:hypothetical protein